MRFLDQSTMTSSQVGPSIIQVSFDGDLFQRIFGETCSYSLLILSSSSSLLFLFVICLCSLTKLLDSFLSQKTHDLCYFLFLNSFLKLFQDLHLNTAFIDNNFWSGKKKLIILLFFQLKCLGNISSNWNCQSPLSGHSTKNKNKERGYVFWPLINHVILLLFKVWRFGLLFLMPGIHNPHEPRVVGMGDVGGKETTLN